MNANPNPQVAYLLADVNDVTTDDLKEITESLEALSCMFPLLSPVLNNPN